MEVATDPENLDLTEEDIALQDEFDELLAEHGEESDALGYRCIIVEEGHTCEFGVIHFLLNRDREHSFAATVRRHVIGDGKVGETDDHYVVGPGEKMKLGCSQTEEDGPETRRTVISESVRP